MANISLTTTDMTWIGVVTTTSDNVGRAVTLFSGSGADYASPASWIVFMAHVNSIWTYRANNYQYTASGPTGLVSLMTVRTTATSLELNQGGGDLPTVNATMGSINATKLIFGYSTEAYRGQIKELVALNGTVDQLTIQKVQGYLANKYGLGLPITHPYSSSPP